MLSQAPVLCPAYSISIFFHTHHAHSLIPQHPAKQWSSSQHDLQLTLGNSPETQNPLNTLHLLPSTAGIQEQSRLLCMSVTSDATDPWASTWSQVLRAVRATYTYGPQQAASSKPHLSDTIKSYTEKIQWCCIHGKLQLRNRLLWWQKVVLIQVFKKIFFFSEIFFKICRRLPLVTDIVPVWKKQLSFQFKCLDVVLRKADNVRANTQ